MCNAVMPETLPNDQELAAMARKYACGYHRRHGGDLAEFEGVAIFAAFSARRVYASARCGSFEGFASLCMKQRCDRVAMRRHDREAMFQGWEEAGALGNTGEFLPFDPPDSSPEPWTTIDHEPLRAAVDSLPDQLRHVIQERYFIRRKYSELAAELGVSIEAVRQRVVAGVAKLREMLIV